MGTRMKFCGMRRREDIEAVNRIRPDYIGFICTDRFWRYIPPEKAAELKAMLDPSIRAVGVFVDEPYEKIADYLKKGIIDIVQLHGNESEYYIRKLRDVMAFQNTIAPVIQACRVRTPAAKRRSAETVPLLRTRISSPRKRREVVCIDTCGADASAGGSGPSAGCETCEFSACTGDGSAGCGVSPSSGSEKRISVIRPASRRIPSASRQMRSFSVPEKGVSEAPGEALSGGRLSAWMISVRMRTLTFCSNGCFLLPIPAASACVSLYFWYRRY